MHKVGVSPWTWRLMSCCRDLPLCHSGAPLAPVGAAAFLWQCQLGTTTSTPCSEPLCNPVASQRDGVIAPRELGLYRVPHACLHWLVQPTGTHCDGMRSPVVIHPPHFVETEAHLVRGSFRQRHCD